MYVRFIHLIPVADHAFLGLSISWNELLHTWVILSLSAMCLGCFKALLLSCCVSTCLWVPGHLGVGSWGCGISVLLILILPYSSPKRFISSLWMVCIFTKRLVLSDFKFFCKLDRGEILSHCGFNLWCPDFKCGWRYFYVFFGHSSFLFCEISVHIFCSFLFYIVFFWVANTFFQFVFLFN